MEKEFDISIPDEDLTAELFSTLGTLTGYVVRKLSATAQSAPRGALSRST
jgi:hypothetical protein